MGIYSRTLKRNRRREDDHRKKQLNLVSNQKIWKHNLILFYGREKLRDKGGKI